MYKKILKSLREYKRESVQAPLLISLEVILECFIPLFMASLIDQMTESSLQPVIYYGGILLALAMLSLFCGVMAGKKAATASCGLAKNLKQDLYYKVQDFSFSDIDKFSTASIVTRLTTDVTNVQNAYGMLLRIAVRTPLMLIVSIFMSFAINPKIACIYLGIIPVLGCALFIIIKVVMPIFRRIFKIYDNMNNFVQENVADIRVVKSFVREDYEIQKFEKISNEVRKEFTKVEKIIALNNPIMTFCIYLSMILSTYIGAEMIVLSEGTQLTTGKLTSIITYGVQILIAMMMLSMVFVMVTISMESINRIAEILSYEATLKNPENPVTEVKSGDISFENVSFKYSEKSKKNAVEDINLNIKSGETVGIIGGTGSAKSTLIQLISRLYDVTDGSVKVGGIDVRDYDIKTLREQVSIVLQKNVLFSGTIKENLRWGDKEATDEEIQRVCKLAQADEFIQKFPDKYDTYIERGGTNVSGGQKQRLCIARALLKKPKILILDDSTSAVDTKTDALIRKAFAEEIPDTTKIIIAQRVSSVQNADKIIVLEKGRIAEEGTHRQLMEKAGIYKEVYESQNRKEVE